MSVWAEPQDRCLSVKEKTLSSTRVKLIQGEGVLDVIDTDWLAAASDSDEAVALTERLVCQRSYPGEEAAVQQEVAAWLSEMGIESEMQDLHDGRQNVIATLVNGDGPTLLLNGHVDTALAADGWNTDPWEPVRDGDRLYGLGACDMKAGVAAAMLATRALDRHRDLWRGTLIFTSVVDEEAYSVGAQGLVERSIKADACIVTEPRWTEVIVGGVGKVLVRGDVIGKAAHGAMPEQGVNAAVEAARLIARVDALPLGDHPTMRGVQSVLSLNSGSAQYVITIPDHARFLVNRHIVPGETGEDVLAGFRELAASLDSPATFEFSIDPPYYPAWEIGPQHPLVDRIAAAYAAEVGHEPARTYHEVVTDGNYFCADLGIPTVVFGPGGANVHQANEWVDVPSISAVVRIILRTALATFSA